jgi:hypothetical protein
MADDGRDATSQHCDQGIKYIFVIEFVRKFEVVPDILALETR